MPLKFSIPLPNKALYTHVLAQPQPRRAALLRRAYATVHLAGTTDDASVIERLGEPVLVVEGDSRNIKITAQEDLDLVRAIMR